MNPKEKADKWFFFEKKLSARIIKPDGRIIDLGVVGQDRMGSVHGGLGVAVEHPDSLKARIFLAIKRFWRNQFGVVTDAGVNFLVDAFQNLVEIELMKFHASGTGVTAEAVGDTALVTEVETRATGSLVEGASANIFKTVGTQTYTATRTIAEHGIFSASSGGTLWDRTLLGATIGVVNLDKIEWTYELTCNAGG